MPTSLLDPLTVEREATERKIEEVAVDLRNTLGPQITAYLSGLEDPAMVDSWVESDMMRRPEVDMRLRYAYQAARMLTQAFSADTAKAWFFGSNSRLDDRAPAYVLRHAQTPDDVRFVVPVARAFAGVEH